MPERVRMPARGMPKLAGEVTRNHTAFFHTSSHRQTGPFAASPPICKGSSARARAHIALFATCQRSVPFATHGVRPGRAHAPPLAHACSLLLVMSHGLKEHVWCTILTWFASGSGSGSGSGLGLGLGLGLGPGSELGSGLGLANPRRRPRRCRGAGRSHPTAGMLRTGRVATPRGPGSCRSGRARARSLPCTRRTARRC